MAVIAEENFESYTSGDSLNGKTGGTGWASAWFSSHLISNAYSQTSPNSTLVNTFGSSRRVISTPSTPIKIDFYINGVSVTDVARRIQTNLYDSGNSNFSRILFEVTVGNQINAFLGSTQYTNLGTLSTGQNKITLIYNLSNPRILLNDVEILNQNTILQGYPNNFEFQSLSFNGVTNFYLDSIIISDLQNPNTNFLQFF